MEGKGKIGRPQSLFLSGLPSISEVKAERSGRIKCVQAVGWAMELVSVVQLSLRPDKTQVQMHIPAMEYELNHVILKACSEVLAGEYSYSWPMDSPSVSGKVVLFVSMLRIV